MPSQNPFTPSFGSSPPLLVGRDDVLENFADALDSGPGALGRATLLTGARGAGKTVMLNALEDTARSRGWLVVSETARAGFAARLSTDALPRLLAEHDPEASQRRITGLTLPFRAGGFTTSTEHQHQAQPSLRSEIERLTDVLAPHETGLLITVDEVHGAGKEDLQELTHTLQHARREDRDVAFVAAGLPGGVRDKLLNDELTTFLRRADRVHLGAVSPRDVAQALHEPIRNAGRSIEPDALQRAATATQGYPFLVQLVGHYTWNANRGTDAITEVDAENGIAAAQRRLGQLVHEPSLADLSAVDRTYLAAMAIDDGPANTRDIARRMNVEPNYATRYRQRLIDAELITPVRYGQVDFALPGLRAYLREHAVTDALTTRAAFPQANQPATDPSQTRANQDLPATQKQSHQEPGTENER